MIAISLNGEMHQLPAPLSVAGLVENFELDPKKIAVEYNLEIIPHSAYGTIVISDGDRLEIVEFIGGG